MNRLAFWNNPLVVSSLRVKYRRGSPASLASLYVLVTASGGLLLKHFEPTLQLTIPWERLYFIGLLAFQFVISGVLAYAMTQFSINSDVTNGTFDFQRIAGMPPRQILLGKMLGESILAFLLLLSSVPMLVWCCLLGGATPEELAVSLVNLVVFALTCGAIGLVHPLRPSERKNTSPSNAAAGLILFAIFGAPWIFAVMVNASWMVNNSWGGMLIGLATPLGFFRGLIDQNIWMAGLDWYGLTIPFFIGGPVTQLILAAMAFSSMERRLVHPSPPILSKAQAYGIVATVDLLSAGVIFVSADTAASLTKPFMLFCLTHVLITLSVTFAMTPSRECLQSWTWRRHERRNPLKDYFFGVRSTVGGAIWAFAGIGLAVFWLAIVLPVFTYGIGTGDSAQYASRLLGVSIALALMPFAHLAAYQFCSVCFGKGGAVVFLLTGGLLMMVPIIVGETQSSDAWRSLSPASYIAEAFRDRGRVLDPTILFFSYFAVATGAVFWMRRWQKSHRLKVKRTLTNMGVVAEPAG